MFYQRSKINVLFNNIDKFENNTKLFVKYLVKVIAEVLIYRRDYKGFNINEVAIDAFIVEIEKIILEMYEDYLNRSKSDDNLSSIIEYVGSGRSSITFRIGDNVIKFSNTSLSYLEELIDSNDLIPVYYRKLYQVGNNTYFKVEVNPYVNKVSLQEEELYSIYVNIRNLGYIWNDPKQENIGSIITTEGCRIDGIMRKPAKEYVPGQLVVFDLEDMAFVGEETPDVVLTEISYHSYNPNVYNFETRWIKEKEEQLSRKRILDEKN